MAEKSPGQQAARNDQQGKNRRDDAGGDVPLGKIDCIEIDTELGKSEEGRREDTLAADAEALTLPPRKQRHGSRRNDETISHRPLRRNCAKLSADYDPG